LSAEGLPKAGAKILSASGGIATKTAPLYPPQASIAAHHIKPDRYCQVFTIKSLSAAGGIENSPEIAYCIKNRPR
jgi:hypothetical protein